MSDEYRTWIRENVSKPHSMCRVYSERMRQAFPELRLARGHYHDAVLGRIPHWWLVAPDDEIVDPTAAQFPTLGDGEYELWDESNPEPTGKCFWCGEWVFHGDSCCDDECSRSYAASVLRDASTAKGTR